MPTLQKQVLFTGQQRGYYLYRIPSLIVSKKNTVLAFCEARRHTGADDDEIDIAMRRSFDNGKTWDEQHIIVSDGIRTCSNLCSVVDMATGTILLLFCKDNQQVFLTKSYDDGQTWTEPKEITNTTKNPNWTYVGTGPGHGIQLKSNRILIPGWSDTSPGLPTWRTPLPGWGKIQSSYAFYSDDGGENWVQGEEMTTNASDECEAVELENGLIYMTMRSRQNKKQRAYSYSKDQGHTWTPVEYDPNLPEPSCQGSIIRFDTEKILLCHPSDQTKRAELTVRLSNDNCRTWQINKIIEQGGSAYSDLAVTQTKQILCLYEKREEDANTDERHIVLASFKIDWVEK